MPLTAAGRTRLQLEPDLGDFDFSGALSFDGDATAGFDASGLIATAASVAGSFGSQQAVQPAVAPAVSAVTEQASSFEVSGDMLSKLRMMRSGVQAAQAPREAFTLDYSQASAPTRARVPSDLAGAIPSHASVAGRRVPVVLLALLGVGVVGGYFMLRKKRR